MTETDEFVTIERRFCGPPDSANGGYTCGVTARALGAQPAEVTLRRPPPLDRPLRVRHHDGSVALLDGESVVSEARPAPVRIDPPTPVAVEDAIRASERFDVADYTATHPFPTCFTCGPSRSRRDGLGLFPAPIPGRGELVAWPWVCDATVARADGLADPTILWAAMDCPSGLAWLTGAGSNPAVLGRMTAVVHRRPAVGEQLVVAGWRARAEGRKREAGSAVWSRDGEVVASSASTWILLTDRQRETFKAAR